MLTRSTRNRFDTLLHAVTLTADDDKPAIIYIDTESNPIVVSRKEFRRRILMTARALADLGIKGGDLIIIAHTQSLESIYAFWGAMALQTIPSMFPTLTEKLDPLIYMRSMAQLARLSEVSAVLTTDDFALVLRSQLECKVLGTSDLVSSSLLPPMRQTPMNADDIAFLQHSSGTTGLQKGVALSHAAVLNQIAAYSDSISLAESDVIVSWLPLYHDMGLIAGFLLPLIQGVPLVLMSPFDWVSHPALLLRAIHDYKGTLCWLPNFAYNHCARRIRDRDSHGLSLATMRLFINCSEPVRHDSHQLFLDRFAGNGLRPDMLGVSYAMAENTFAVTQTPPGHSPTIDMVDSTELATNHYAKPSAADKPESTPRVSCGPPISGTQVRIVDNKGQPVADRHVGEIAIRSNCLLTGYYKRPDLQPFDREGWFMTGDIGYVAGGEVFVVGRHKDLIINAGKNVYPGDIETIINTIPGVKAGRAVVFGVSDEREGTELLAAVVEVTSENGEERQVINRAIRQEVARQAMITLSYVHLVEPKWLIKTSSGKIARGANREKWMKETGYNHSRNKKAAPQ